MVEGIGRSGRACQRFSLSHTLSLTHTLIHSPSFSSQTAPLVLAWICPICTHQNEIPAVDGTSTHSTGIAAAGTSSSPEEHRFKCGECGVRSHYHEGTLVCSQCTLHNPGSSKECDACGQRFPVPIDVHRTNSSGHPTGTTATTTTTTMAASSGPESMVKIVFRGGGMPAVVQKIQEVLKAQAWNQMTMMATMTVRVDRGWCSFVFLCHPENNAIRKLW